MAYKKPKCDCGEELVFETETNHFTRYKITKTGREYKKPYESYDGGAFISDKLICPKCLESYIWDEDEKGRFIRYRKME